MKISIVTPSYNSSETILDTVRSVHSQSYEDIEHIIIDGGSTDSTLQKIESAPNRVAEVVSEEDQGMYDAMNKGIGLASGDYIGILNSDDMYASADAVNNIAALLKNTDSDSCYADLEYVHSKETDKVLRKWKSGPYRHGLFLNGWMPPHPTFFVRKSVYEKYGGFNTDLGTAADYELMLRFLHKERISVSYLPETIIRMRAGGESNASLANRWRANRNDRKAWRINNLRPYPWTLIMKPLRKVGQFFGG